MSDTKVIRDFHMQENMKIFLKNVHEKGSDRYRRYNLKHGCTMKSEVKMQQYGKRNFVNKCSNDGNIH